MSKSVITPVKMFIIFAIILTVVPVIFVVSSVPKKAPNFTFDYLEKHHFEKYNKFVHIDEYDLTANEAYIYNDRRYSVFEFCDGYMEIQNIYTYKNEKTKTDLMQYDILDEKTISAGDEGIMRIIDIIPIGNGNFVMKTINDDAHDNYQETYITYDAFDWSYEPDFVDMGIYWRSGYSDYSSKIVLKLKQ